jgi:hypothetical protein
VEIMMKVIFAQKNVEMESMQDYSNAMIIIRTMETDVVAVDQLKLDIPAQEDRLQPEITE